ncbi:MAG: fused MFS/spermidine synthase [Betaproteobacteria bacterium]
MKRKTELVFVLFFFSGLAGLIYESVWSHYVKLFLGHAAYAQTLVLVVFIGGLALGSWLCARMAERIRNPLRVYAFVEGGIGVLALVFHWVFVHAVDWGYSTLLPATCDQASTFCVAQWGLSAVLLAPQSILLGATFPLVSSAVLRMSGEHPGHDIASLYFLNSLGAVLGVMASAFVLIPTVGLPGTLMTAGVANVIIALAAYAIAKAAPTQPLVVQSAEVPAEHERWTERRLVGVLLATAMLTGLSSFIYEIVWIRMLSLVLGASTHSFELMLASFILGIALGGLWIRSRVDLYPDTVRLLAYVQLAMGIFAVATVPLYNGAFDFMAWLLSALTHNDGGFVLFNVASTFISLVIMLPATFCAGMTLPLITYRLLRSPTGERSLGTVYAINTLGSILGVIVAVHLLISHIGTPATLVVGAAIDVVLGVVLLLRRPAGRGFPRIPGPAVAALVILVAFGALFRVDPSRSASGVFRTGVAHIASDQILFHRDGKTATVDVLGNNEYRAIRTNGKPDAAMAFDPAKTIPDEYTMALLAMLPLAYQPDAKSAAVIGFGSGSSTTLLLTSDKLERVDTIEIEPAMVEGANLFRPFVDPAYTDKRSHIVIDDAKSYFARGHKRYDIIVSEPSNPWVSGVSSLFTEEFYKRLALYLNDRGVVSQWLHVYEMDSTTFASIIAAFEKTFPNFVLYMPNDGDLVMIARKTGPVGGIDPGVLAIPGLQPTLRKLKLTDMEALRRHGVATSATLKPMFAAYRAAANSDYFPIVDHRASKTRFTKTRVEELAELQTPGVPMLEMLDGTFIPTSTPRPVTAVTMAAIAAMNAWSAYGGMTGVAEARRDANGSIAEEDVGRMLRLWSANCSPEWTFDEIRPAMLRVSELITPQMRADYATTVWEMLASSRCGKALAPEQRRWLELFHAAAARDATRMAMLGESLAVAARQPGPESEYAFFAATTGFLCKGEAGKAREFMEKNLQRDIRSGQKVTLFRYLHSIAVDPAASAAVARCR